MFKLFWPPHEGTIFKKTQTHGTNKQKQQKNKKNYSGHHMKGAKNKTHKNNNKNT